MHHFVHNSFLTSTLLNSIFFTFFLYAPSHCVEILWSRFGFEKRCMLCRWLGDTISLQPCCSQWLWRVASPVTTLACVFQTLTLHGNGKTQAGSYAPLQALTCVLYMWQVLSHCWPALPNFIFLPFRMPQPNEQITTEGKQFSKNLYMCVEVLNEQTPTKIIGFK